mmetsp:Transcript_31546/g.102791  ORF Transcript_31546/g.102791 Transcript_31546/m.102791 type:complete len:420 (+) Transcript_31546:1272-2531(+)
MRRPLEGERAWLDGAAVAARRARARSRGRPRLHHLRDDRLRGEHHAGDRARVLERRARHLFRIDDPHLEKVAEGVVHGVVAKLPLASSDLLDDNLTFDAGVVGDDAHGGGERLHHNVRSERLLRVLYRRLDVGDKAREVHHRRAPARHNALLHRRERRVLRVLYAKLAVLHLCLRGGAHLDDGHPAGELGDALRDFLVVVERVRLAELLLQLRHAGGDFVRRPRISDDGGRVVLDGHLARHPELVHLRPHHAQAEVLGDKLRVGHDGDVLQERLPALAKAGRLDRRDIEDAPELVHDEGSERLASHILGDDEQRWVARLRHLFEDRHQILDRLELLIRHEHARIVKFHQQPLLVGDELRRDVPPVNLHPLLNLHRRVEPCARLDGQHAISPNLVDRICNHLPNLIVVPRRDGRHCLDVV